MAIALEKILAVNIFDYLKAMDESLADYKLYGINATVIQPAHQHSPSASENVVSQFAKLVPNGAAIVVDYNQKPKYLKNGSLIHYSVSGIALIKQE